MKPIPSFAAVLLTAIAGAIPMHAAVIYDTFGPEPFQPGFNLHSIVWAYSHGSGVGVGNCVAAPFRFSGLPYVPTAITLDIQLNGLESGPNLQIAIHPDSDGSPSLSPVTFLNPSPTLVGLERQTLTYSFNGSSVLNPDTDYWLVLQPHTYAVATESFNANYYFSTTSYLPNSGFATRFLPYPDSSAWSPWVSYGGPSPAFRLEGTAVPEPAAWTLLALGGAGLRALRRRRGVGGAANGRPALFRPEK